MRFVLLPLSAYRVVCRGDNEVEVALFKPTYIGGLYLNSFKLVNLGAYVGILALDMET